MRDFWFVLLGWVIGLSTPFIIELLMIVFVKPKTDSERIDEIQRKRST